MNLVNKTVKGINKIKRERDEWMKRYEDVVNSYKAMIEEAQKKAEEAVTIVKGDKREHEQLKDDVAELKQILKDFYVEHQKRLQNLEKTEKDLVDAKKEFLIKFDKQEKINSSLKEEVHSIKEQLKRIENRQEKHERVIEELKSSMKEFKHYIIEHLNSANIEYERRFERFKQSYENAIEVSRQLNRELKKIDSIQKVLENFHKRIISLENKLDKIFNSLNVSEKRIDQLRKERELIDDKMFSLKEEFYYKIKELEDAISIVESRIKKKN